MKITKVLNQNAVLVIDQGQEKVATGKGIGFNRKKNDLVFPKEIERLFVMEPEGQQKLQTLLSQIDEKYFFATQKVIEYAEDLLDEKLNEHIYIGLTDHIAFAADNVANGIIVKNKLLDEIELLYEEEFAIAQWAVGYLTKELDTPFSYDEAGYITIHLHSARMGRSNNQHSLREISIIAEIVKFVESALSIDLHAKHMALTYSRMVNHLRFFIQRYHQQELAFMDEEILLMVKKKYPESFRLSENIRKLLKNQFHFETSEEELGYLTIHLERIRTQKNIKGEIEK